MRKIFISFCFVLVSGISPSFAQDCDPDLDPFCEVNPDDPPVPLDGGVAFLVAGAVAYGIKKINNRNTELSSD